jgi:2-keto-4-pentenoate hydratase/2-oxohepta-3-ene-1,7-dioic acid hydratase in catechol pathway
LKLRCDIAGDRFGKRWLLGKSFDASCPMGPWLVSADELDGSDARASIEIQGTGVLENPVQEA